MSALTVVVSAHDAGRRLDVVVAGIDAVGSRAEAQRLIEDGRVRVNGASALKRQRLSEGDEVEVEPRDHAPATALEPERVPHEVVYEDEHLLVVDKPAGIVTHPSKGHDTGTLVHGLVARQVAGGDDPRRPGIVHRLDRDTSGLLVVARSPRAHRRLQQQLRERTIERRYVALVHGAMPPALTVDRPLGRDTRNRTRQRVVAEGGREAITHLRTLAVVERFTYVEARLETGRTHQIRVHLESAGHPVVGDQTYGKRRPDLGLSRQFLHAWHLEFPHPETGETVSADSALPADLAAALDRVDPERLLPRRPDR